MAVLRQPKQQKPQDGFVMVTLVIILLAVLLPLVVLVSIAQLSSLTTTARAANLLKARSEAVSLANAVYADAVRYYETNQPSAAATSCWADASEHLGGSSPDGFGFFCSGTVTNVPGWIAAADQTQTGGEPVNYANYVGEGASGHFNSACPNAGGPCANFSVNYAPATASTVASATLRVDAFDACSGAPKLCVEASFVVQLVKQGYLDWLWYNGSNVVGTDVAGNNFVGSTSGTTYSGKDGIWASGQTANGPVRTNASTNYYCGSPTFEQVVVAASSPVLSASSDCTATGSPSVQQETVIPATPLPVTSQISDLGTLASGESLGTGTSCSATPISSPSDWSFSTPISVTLNGSTVTVDETSSGDTCTYAWPSAGIIYDTADVTITGTADDALTVASNASVTVQDNLEYAGGTCTDTTVPPTTCEAIIGIVAADDIVVAPASPTTSQIVDAVLMAPEGDVYDADWDVDTSATDGATLTYIGSIVEENQGVFGIYNPTTGAPQRGFSTNNFVYDNRLVTMQPPHFFTPYYGEWIRLSIAEVPPQ